MAQFPNTTAADGIWTLKKVRRAILGETWPEPPVLDGEYLYQTPGTYSFTAPEGVTSVSVVCVGGGGLGGDAIGHIGGEGGGLGWKNNITVVPGNSYTVVVGAGGVVGAVDGGDSYFIDNTTVAGFGGAHGGAGNVASGGGFVGDGGGNGGGTSDHQSHGHGGSGAGGYSGDGGRAVGNSNGGAGTGGAGGAGADGGGSSTSMGHGGGGVGVYGEGTSGASSGSSGIGGSGGQDGDIPTQGEGGDYGGGGGQRSAGSAGSGGGGAVRIVWDVVNPPQFPSTNVQQRQNQTVV